MKDQINTIRDGIAAAIDSDTFIDKPVRRALLDALTALAELERMAGEPVAWKHDCAALLTNDVELWVDNCPHCGKPRAAPPAQQQYEAGDMASAHNDGFRAGVASVTQQQEPVAWAMPKGDGTFIDVITPAEHAREEGSYTVPLFAHPAAQQPQKLEDVEQYRMQMAGISTAAVGYWKEGDSIHPDYDTPALRDVAKLYTKYDALYKAQQPQAEAVPVVDRVYEAAKRLVDHADFQLGGVLSAKSKARDIPSNAASKVKARHLASLRDALAKTPQQAEMVPSDVVRDAVAAEREACAALAQGYAGQVGDVAWAVAAAIRGRGNAAIAQQKGGV